MKERKIEGTVFAINSRFFSFCELDLLKTNVDFLRGLDPGYFEYIIERNAYVDEELSLRASIALRIALHHAVETFFSLACAYAQAPMCMYAWISKCRSQELKVIVKRIEDADQSLPVVQKLEKISWSALAGSIWIHAPMGKQKTQAFLDAVTQFLEFLTWEFTDHRTNDQYNSLKHGFRVTPGGTPFSLRPFGMSPDKKLEFPLSVEANYGMSCFKIVRVHEDRNCRHFRSIRECSNWGFEETVNRLRLVAACINDVISASLIYCDENPKSVIFKLPDQLEMLANMDNYIAKGSSVSMQPVLSLGAECKQTESELKQVFEDWARSEKYS